MSDRDIIKKYESKQESFVATEDDLKSIIDASSKPTPAKTAQPEPPPASLPVKFEKLEVAPAPQTNDDLSTDYQYIRTNLYAITERSVEALNNLVQIADQSQHPRAYEVVALLVNTIANAQKDLMTIHREKAKIEGITNKAKPDIVNNNLFVGNTAQLDEIIAKMSKKNDE